MSFFRRVLEPPRYKLTSGGGALFVPSRRELLSELLYKTNVFRSRKQWLPLLNWAATLALLPFFLTFFLHYFRWHLLAIGFVYSMVVLGTHGTVYLHRYGTHRAFAFKNRFYRFLCRNLVIKLVPEEIYIVSHHVHHRYSEKPGDPYNVHGGWLYCFLADTNHQPIAQTMSRGDYDRVARLVSHCGVKCNDYEAYQRWGTISDPLRTVAHFVLNWMFWYAAFYLVGGHALATAIFGMSFIWIIGIRTFNYDGHGGGRDKRREGVDFDADSIAINQLWPGFVAGEWHNNHHLYPRSARAGFLPYQVDLAWAFIGLGQWLGGIHQVHDRRADFYRDHYEPYRASLRPTVRVPSREA